jgi:hypothetical protein
MLSLEEAYAEALYFHTEKAAQRTELLGGDLSKQLQIPYWELIRDHPLNNLDNIEKKNAAADQVNLWNSL